MTSITKSTTRVTVGELDGNFGPDRGRKLIVELAPGDVINLRPKGTRQRVSVRIADVYRYALKCQAGARGL